MWNAAAFGRYWLIDTRSFAIYMYTMLMMFTRQRQQRDRFFFTCTDQFRMFVLQRSLTSVYLVFVQTFFFCSCNTLLHFHVAFHWIDEHFARVSHKSFPLRSLRFRFHMFQLEYYTDQQPKCTLIRCNFKRKKKNRR